MSLGDVPPIPPFSSGLNLDWLWSVITGLGALAAPCLVVYLPPIWDAAALLLAFLLALSFLHTPDSLFDGLAVTVDPSYFPFCLFWSSSCSPSTRRRRKRGRRKSRYYRHRWKRLPFGMAIRARRRNLEDGVYAGRPYTVLRAWRQKRNWKAKQRMKRRRDAAAIARFLTPSEPQLPAHYQEFGYVSDEVLSKFCEGKGDAFLNLPRTVKRLNANEHQANVDSLLNRYSNIKQDRRKRYSNIARFACDMEPTSAKPSESVTFTGCPLVWDTGASFGLTPFRADFIDYVECDIPVKDISKTNRVIGICTTLHRFRSGGKSFWMPCLSYHLPSAEIRLFSPQVFHTLYGGESTVGGGEVVMHVPNPKGDLWDIRINIDRDGGNVPMVYDCAVTAKEMRVIGPQIRSATNIYHKT